MQQRRGIGHQQQSFFKTLWQHRLSHGGLLRQKRAGRGQRPLSCWEPLHLVFKIDRLRLRPRGLRTPLCFSLIHKIIKKYSLGFRVKIEQISIQGDHLHLLVRAQRRSKYQDFFRVVAGPIAQRFEKEGLIHKKATGTPQIIKPGTGLWKYRPFTRVVRGWRAYRIVRDYIRMNELTHEKGKCGHSKSKDAAEILEEKEWPRSSVAKRPRTSKQD